MIRHNYSHQHRVNSAYDIGHIHEKLLLFSWIVLANIGLWAHYFKYRSWAIQLHKAVMALLTLLTSISIFMAIAYFGFNNHMPPLHVWLGVVIGILSIIASGGGIVCSIIESSPFFSPFIVKLVRKAHKIAGWGVLVLVLVQFISTQSKKTIIFTLVVNLLSYGLFVLLKVTQGKMQKSSIRFIQQAQRNYPDLRLVKNNKDLSFFNEDYFIFANKVYDINKVINNHPAGWEIIKAIKTRQVDRYLYGIQPLQNLTGKQVYVHRHTNSSLSMMGEPLARLYSTVFYRNFQQINSTRIQELTKPCKNKSMYAAYLGNGQKLLYKGYTQLSQLGKYYTVNMGNQTKLYSIVNFLQGSNLNMMSKITGNVFWQKDRVIFDNNQIRQVKNQGPFNQYLLPLLIKKYQKGKFTSKFLSGRCTDQVKVSVPMGRGLFLHEVPPGIILMLAAGTGINPFCDLIDLAFKQCLVQERHPLSSELVKNDPVLSSTPFRNWQLALYVSVQQISQIHPISLLQCNQLAKRNRLKIKIRSKDTNNEYYKIFRHIQKEQKRFQSVIVQWAAFGQRLSQIYLCGPPQFNASIVRQLKNCQISPLKYKIM